MDDIIRDSSDAAGAVRRQSSTRPVFYGVLQGSVLGPLLFTMYTADISKVVASHSLQLHQYADHLTLFRRPLLSSLPAWLMLQPG